jgi:ABC-2 type transport system ATP-binding protein
MNKLEIKNLNISYPNGVDAILDMSLTITNGMFGLLGPNGAGKSSLMRTIATLQQPGSGTIFFNGIDIGSEPTFMRKQLGYLPQEFGVYPKISAYRLLDHMAILKGIVCKEERHDQIISLLEQTNLIAHRNKAVHNFSGGMRQRFGIAQALLGRPAIIIVDEPTAGLDPEERNRFNNLLSEIGENVIVILSTHIVEDVMDLCPNMAIINAGSLVVKGQPDEAVRSIKNTIWVKTIKHADLGLYKAKMNVISSKLHAGQLNIFVHSEAAPDGDFTSVDPTLEHYYFTTLSHEEPNTFSHV